MKTYPIEVTEEKLDQLQKLADWQLKSQGFDPCSISSACIRAEEDRMLARKKQVLKEVS